MSKNKPWMLTHSQNWIMAPLWMHSCEGHAAYWMDYLAVTSSTARQPTISLFSSSAVPTHVDRRLWDLTWKRRIVWLIWECESFSLTKCSSAYPLLLLHPPASDIQGLSLRFEALWTKSENQKPYTDSWPQTPSWAVWLCDIYSLFNIKEPGLKVQQKECVPVWCGEFGCRNPSPGGLPLLCFTIQSSASLWNG